MYRCTFAAFATVAVVAPAAAQPLQLQRSFPADALRGTIVVGNQHELTLNGRGTQFAPGVRIRGQDNMFILSGTLAGQKLLVHYTFDTDGASVKDVWILRPEEAAVKPWPTTTEQTKTWSFDRAAQTWTRP